jgi:hypothetical protein
MGSILVAVGHEFGQQRSDIFLAQWQDVSRHSPSRFRTTSSPDGVRSERSKPESGPSRCRAGDLIGEVGGVNAIAVVDPVSGVLTVRSSCYVADYPQRSSMGAVTRDNRASAYRLSSPDLAFVVAKGRFVTACERPREKTISPSLLVSRAVRRARRRRSTWRCDSHRRLSPPRA